MKNTIASGKVYTLDGQFEDISDTHDGKPIFRKVTKNRREVKIIEILKENPHENIVTIYKIHECGEELDDINNCYIDMELLNTNLETFSPDEIKRTMKDVKDFLQKLGIVYIDWKRDNIGVGSDGKLKLFDFDVSGLIDPETKEWINWEIGVERLIQGKMKKFSENGKPQHFYAYNKGYEKAVAEEGTTNPDPIQIDNYAFEDGIINMT